MWQAISLQISNVIEQEFQLQEKWIIDGGDVNESYHIRDGSLSFFVKTNTREFLPMFVSESDGLEALAKSNSLTVPNTITMGTTKNHSYLVLEYLPLMPLDEKSNYDLGVGLANQHRWGEQKEYGFDLDNYIGFALQPNGWHKKWARFFAEQRIGWQLQLLQEKGIVLVDIDEFVALIFNQLSGHNPKPALLHGDLWSGNVSRVGHGAVVYDPACYWGDRECDIAMTELFGGFDESFYRGYQSGYPLDEGYENRKEIYNLYHILNHCNAFGGHYLEEAQQRITTLLAV
jgi:fructosamine-3-kinase